MMIKGGHDLEVVVTGNDERGNRAELASAIASQIATERTRITEGKYRVLVLRVVCHCTGPVCGCES